MMNIKERRVAIALDSLELATSCLLEDSLNDILHLAKAAHNNALEQMKDEDREFWSMLHNLLRKTGARDISPRMLQKMRHTIHYWKAEKRETIRAYKIQLEGEGWCVDG